MPTVETVRGPVDTTELGRTLMHEHVFVLTPDAQQNWPQEWDEEERVRDAVEKLSALPKAGYRTIVDPTVVGLGRYIPRIQRINEQVPDLNIVAATGAYTYADVPNFFAIRGPGVLPDLPEPMVELFTKDITDGIAGTGVKAAFLKCAIDHHGLMPGVERIMRACAKTHRATGVPITIHTHPESKTGLEVRRVLDEEGVDFGRVVLGHSGDSTDADHLEDLARSGFLLGMDRFGINATTPFEDRVGIVATLCERGLADHLVLSHDAACYIDWIDPMVRPMLADWHYLHIENDVLPALRERGVTDEQITTMLVDNPRRYFEHDAGY